MIYSSPDGLRFLYSSQGDICLVPYPLWVKNHGDFIVLCMFGLAAQYTLDLEIKIKIKTELSAMDKNQIGNGNEQVSKLSRIHQ